MLKCYDYRCPDCGTERRDVIMEQDQKTLPCTNPDCAGTMERAWLMGTLRNVVGDECDVWAKHGICNDDGSPRHYTSKTDMRREAERRGLVQHVEHIPAQGSDRSKHTSRWV